MPIERNRRGENVAPAIDRRIQRRPGLEWLRVGLTLAVVALHSGMAYLIRPFPELAWSTHDDGSSVTEILCWLANCFVMPSFFILGGFAAAGLLDRLTPSEMVRHRLRRLGGPFLLGCVLILPLDLYAWLTGWVIDGKITMSQLLALKIPDDVSRGLWGPSHLWFLQYLLLFCVAYAVFRSRAGRLNRVFADAIVSTPGVVTAATLTAIPLYCDPQILLGFRHRIFVQPYHLAFFAPMFAFGACWARQQVAQFDWRHVLIGVGCWVVSTPSRDVWVDGSAQDAVTRLIAVCGYAYAGWFISVGLFGTAMRMNRPMPWQIAYLANASFWIYLFHHPVAGFTQVVLKLYEIAPATKFVLTFGISLWLCLGTFEVVVKRTAIGRILGSTRPKQSRAASDLTEKAVAAAA